MDSLSANPYVGPRTFTKDERHLFFGREREARDLRALVISEQLVLFYAQSGAGKSSLINTRLVPDLEQKDFEVLPVSRVSGDAPSGVEVENIYVYNLMHNLLQCEIDPHSLANLSLSKFLDFLSRNQAGLFCYDETERETAGSENLALLRRALIIDQFEELFSMHPEAWRKREDFFCQLADAMRADPYLWVVLVMREDYIASLDPYAHLVPGGMRTRYYMQRLEHDAAVEAIKNPVEKMRPFAEGVAEKLADDLSRIKMQTSDVTDDSATSFEFGQYVEPVQLQVVCHNLWNELMLRDPGGHEITLQHLQDIGDVDQTLGKYYAERVKGVSQDKHVQESAIRNWFEHTLITPDGIRNIVTQSASLGLDPDVIQALHSDLVRSERRGGVIVYELTHDRLVEPIRADNKIWFDKNSSLLQQQAKLWDDQGRSDGLLLRDQALLDAIDWASRNEAELTQIDRELLKASQEHQDQLEKQKTIERMKLEQAEEQVRSANRARRLTRVAFSLLGLALIAVGFAVWYALRAADAAEQASIAETDANILKNAALARELAGQAMDNLEKQLDLSILLGLEAYNKNLENKNLDQKNPENPNAKIIPQVQSILFDSMQRSRRLRGFLARPELPAKRFQYSPDGKRIALQTEKGITLWDITQNMAAGDIPDSQFATQYVFSPDSSKLMFLDYSGVVFWDVEHAKKLRSSPLNNHTGAVVEIVYSAGGENFATVGENGEVTLWEAQTENFLFQFQAKVHAFSPDGNKVAILDRQGDIKVYGMVDARQEGVTIPMEPDTVTALALNQTGDTLAIGDKDGNIVLWSIGGTYTQRDSFSVGSLAIDFLKFNSDGKLLLFQTSQGLKTWNLDDHRAVSGDPVVLSGDPVFSPTGKVFAEAASSGQILLHDIPEGASQKPIPGTKGVFSQDGSLLAVFDTKGLKLFDVSTAKETGEAFAERTDSPLSMTFSWDGKYLAIGEQDGSIEVWDLASRKLQRRNAAENRPKNSPENSPAVSLAFSPDGTVLLVGRKNGLLTVWDQQHDKTEKIETGYQGAISSMNISPGGKYLFSVANDGTEVIDLESLDPLGVFAGSNIIFSDDETLFALFDHSTGTGTAECSLWSVADHKNIQSGIPCSYGQFSPTGESFAATASTVIGTPLTITTLWKTSDGTQIGGSMDGIPLSPAFSPHGEILAIYDSEQSSTRLWNVSTGEAVGEPVYASEVHFSEKGTVAVLAVPNGDLTVVDWATGEVHGVLPNNTFINLSPDGKMLMAKNEINSSIAFWDTGSLEQVGDSITNVTSWTPNSDRTKIAVTTYYSTTIWDGSTFEQVAHLPITASIQFSPDGNYLLAPQYYGNLPFLWDLATDEKIDLGANHGSPQGINPFSPDGKYILLTDTTNSGYILWNIAESRQVGERLAGHAGWVNNGAFDPSGTVQISIQNGGLQYNNANSLIGGSSSYGFLFSPDGESYSVFNAGDGSVSLWSVESPPSIPGVEVQGLEKGIVSALLSPDGETLAAATQEHVSLWNVKDPSQVSQLNDLHVKEPYGVSLSPNGKIAVINYSDTSLSLWDLTKEKPEQIGDPIKDNLNGFSFSPDGKFLLTSPSYQVYQLRDTSTGKTIGEPVSAESFQFTRDSQYVIYYRYYGGNIRVFDTHSGTQIGGPLEASFMGIGPSAALIITQDQKGLALRDASDDMKIKSFIPSDGNTSFVISRNAQYVAAVGQSPGPLLIWDLQTAKQVGKLTDYAGESVAFSPDGQYITLNNYTQGGLILYQALSPNKRVVEGSLSGDSIAFSPDGSLFASYYSYYYYNPELTFYNTSTGNKIEQVDIRGNFQGFGNRGALLVTVKDAKRVNLWDTHDLTRQSTLVDYEGIYRGASLSEDGSTLAVYGSGGVLVMDLTDPRRPTKLVREMSGTVQQMAFSPDGQLLATLASDGIILWDVKSLLPVADPIIAKEAYVSSVKFSPDSKKLVYLDALGNAFEIEIGPNNKVGAPKELLTLNQPCAIGFNAESQLLAVKQNAGKLQILDPNRNEPIELKLDGSCSNPMAFSPDATSFAYNAGDRTYIFTSDKEQGIPFASGPPVVGDQPYYYNSNFLLDGQILSMNGGNGGYGRLYFWDIKSRSLMLASDEAAVLSSSVDGKTLLFLPSENRLVSMDFSPESLNALFEKWKDELCAKAGRNFTSAEWQQYFPDDRYRSTCPEYPAGK